MSEVDRLSNSGLYPALPISDRQRDKREPSNPKTPDPPAEDVESTGSRPRPPKSLIDEYA